MKVREIGTFFVPEAYRDVCCRCDLHPRWRPDGRQLGFREISSKTVGEWQTGLFIRGSVETFFYNPAEEQAKLTGHYIWIPGSWPHKLIPSLEKSFRQFMEKYQ